MKKLALFTINLMLLCVLACGCGAPKAPDVVNETLEIDYNKIVKLENDAFSYYDNITWTSADESIVSASDKGSVHGVGVGETTVTGESDGKVVATYTVKVLYVPATKINITPESENIPWGKLANRDENCAHGLQLSYTLEPTNATKIGYVWSSSNESVATVDDKGYVTPLMPGDAEITITSPDGLSATSKISINQTAFDRLSKKNKKFVLAFRPYYTTGQGHIFNTSNIVVTGVQKVGNYYYVNITDGGRPDSIGVPAGDTGDIIFSPSVSPDPEYDIDLINEAYAEIK